MWYIALFLTILEPVVPIQIKLEQYTCTHTHTCNKLLCCVSSEYFLVQLITSSNKAIDPATYLIHVQAKKIVGYNAIGSPKVVWTWESTDLYGYRLERETIPEVEIIIGM